MEKNLILAGIIIKDRLHAATKVQEVLTKYSEIIFCRMGVSDLANYCRLGSTSEQAEGVITLTITGAEEKAREMVKAVEEVPGVTMKYLVLN